MEGEINFKNKIQFTNKNLLKIPTKNSVIEKNETENFNLINSEFNRSNENTIRLINNQNENEINIDTKSINENNLNKPHKLNSQNLEYSKPTKYFDVYYRKIFFSKDNIIFNIIFYDVTDLISARIKISEENIKKQKVLAKIAHEFKTPLTSIISLIGILRDSFDDFHKKIGQTNNNDTIETLDLIQNLSRYVIFLTSDIINYSNPDNINDVKLNNQRINFREISVFCFDILKSLLYCNISKLKKIKPEIIFDGSLEFMNFFSDEVRIKQILLNFISNSVKFTSEGFIKLIFHRHEENDTIVLTIEDSGRGIKEEDKLLIFKDFFRSENYNINSLIDTNIGTGLGLSICKNLADKMEMKIEFSSTFGIGTKLSLVIF